MAGLNSWLMANIATILLIGFVLILALAGLAVWSTLRLRRLEQHYRTLVAGTGGGSLEAILEEHVGQVRGATAQVRELDSTVRRLERDGRGHIQRVGFLRFNPFRDTGGDQSFAVALADADGNGVVISSLHSREVTRVYGKPLIAWETSYQLTDEEQQAIARARGERN